MIIPSLSGFGFSTSTISHMYMSAILQDLMFKLGYKKFDIQGGNSFTYCVMPRVPHAKNFSIIDICKKIEPELHFSGSIERIPQLSSQIPFKKSRKFLIMTERRVGAVSEDVLAIGLRDSPVALAAYILEGYLKNINCA